MEMFGGVYEHSPWVAQGAIENGLTSSADAAEGLAAHMAGVVDSASKEQKLDLLRAHPDLAGRLALAGEMTASSLNEQSAAGLDQCTPEELARFTELNNIYTGTFGFPFILAVRGYHRTEILELFEQRTANSPEAEFAEALRQVNKIARLRIEAMFSG